MIKLLFVCTGNICRSPTAEGVFRHLVREAGLTHHFEIDSAGTDSYHEGAKPDARSVKVAAENGISLEDQQARRLRTSDFDHFHYIFAMDSGHFYEISERKPSVCHAKIEMFCDQDVPDPWYGAGQDFGTVFALIREGAEKLLARLRKEQGL